MRSSGGIDAAAVASLISETRAAQMEFQAEEGEGSGRVII